MANIKSSIKSAKKDRVRRARNQQVKSTVRGAVREVRTACAAADAVTGAQQLQTATQLIDKAVSKGVMHRNTAARRKSRLAKLVAATKAAGEPEAS